MDRVLYFFGAWYNWIFVLPLMICALLITLQVVLGLLDVDAHHDAGHALEADHDFDLDHASEGLMTKLHLIEVVFGPLGLGRVPLSVLLETFGVTWGLSGILLHWITFKLSPSFLPLALLVTIPAALAIAAASTRTVARALEKVVPAYSTTSIRSHAFVGQVGTVTSARISEGGGEVKVTRKGEPAAWIAVRLAPECAGTEIPSGAEVIVTHYDSASNLFLVAPAPSVGDPDSPINPVREGAFHGESQ